MADFTTSTTTATTTTSSSIANEKLNKWFSTEASSSHVSSNTSTSTTPPQSSWWHWRPTSDNHLAFVEKKMLKAIEPLPYQQQFITVPDPHQTKREISINTIKVGNHEKSKPTLVLLHGFGAALGFWICNLKALSESANVYAIDLPGFGRSSRFNLTGIDNAEKAEDLFVDILNGWSEELELDKFTILGHSFGAYLASCFAMRHPEKLNGLVLADPHGVPKKPENVEQKYSWRWRTVSTIATYFNPLAVIRAAGPWGPGLISRFRADIPEKFEHIWPNPEDRAVVADYIYHSNSQNPCGESLFAMLTQGLGWVQRPLIDRLPNDLSKSIPILIMYGSNSWMNPKMGEQMYRTMVAKGYKVDYQILWNSGHHIYVDTHEEFNAIVSSWVVDRK